jgi:hypothetical protein
MVWYNKRLDDDNYCQFSPKNGGDLDSIQKCFLTDPDFQGSQINERHVSRLEANLTEAWKIFTQLKQVGVTYAMGAPHSHLKGFIKKTKRPNYDSCIFVGIKHPNEQNAINTDVINLSVDVNAINIEIRYPLAEFFSPDHFESDYPHCKLGYINGLRVINLRRFLNQNMASQEDLTAVLNNYVTAVNSFLAEGGKLRTYGESKAEVILFKDLEHIYATNRCLLNNNWLRHGQRPIRRASGSLLELDLQMEIATNGKQVRIAIEVQGPEHYQNSCRSDWSNVNSKHEEKKRWCMVHDYLFVWLDWKYFHKNIVMDGQKYRKVDDRRRLTKEMVDQFVSAYIKGERYIEIPANIVNNRFQSNI